MSACPHCSETLPLITDAYCPFCHEPLNASEEQQAANEDSATNRNVELRPNHNPYDPNHTAATQTATKQQLWNPSAAANWSLVLSPAFGAYLHALNWNTLNDSKRAKANMAWVWITVAFLLFNGLTIFFPISPMVDFVMRIASLGILIAWYFGYAKPQIKYVKETFGKDYGRKPWGLPLLLGFSAIALYFLTCIGLAAVFLVQNPADIAVALEFDVKNSMVQELKSDPQFQGVSIRSVSLQHDNGNS